MQIFIIEKGITRIAAIEPGGTGASRAYKFIEIVNVNYGFSRKLNEVIYNKSSVIKMKQITKFSFSLI